MYLDAPLKEHTLLQAIARVNRPHGDEKTYGLVVDYWGVSAKLQDALAIFSTTDVQGALTPSVDELPRLQSRHAAAMRFFQAVADPNDLNACVQVLEPEDVRAAFDLAFQAVQPVDGHAAAGPARAGVQRRPALAGQDSRRGPCPLPRRPARPLGLRGEGPEADCRRCRRGRRPDPGQGGPALLPGVRGEGRGTQDRRGEGERDGARHPPRDQRPPGREPRLLPVVARAAGGNHRRAAPGTPGCGPGSSPS